MSDHLFSVLGSLTAAAAPAGGAALDQVAIATVGATVATGVLLFTFAAHRAGRIRWLGRLSEWAAGQTGVPGWAALPGLALGVSLLVAVFGMYWDISLHIDNGRD